MSQPYVVAVEEAPISAGRFDALVVGSGPAGSVAATLLARGGARVALVDKARFPRDKACGDLVGPRRLSRGEADLYRDWIANRRHLERIVTDMEKVSAAAGAILLRQAATPEPSDGARP